MVEVKRTLDDRGFERLIVTTPKLKSKVFIEKSNNGYSSYYVYLERGATPAALSGVYTVPDNALKAIKSYLSTKKKSATVRRDEKYKRNHAPAASKDNS